MSPRRTIMSLLASTIVAALAVAQIAAQTATPAAPAAPATPATPASPPSLKLPRVSPNATLSQTIGLTDLTVTYSRPGVKNRVIWGDLVPYDKPWRTGANEATTFTTTGDIQFGGQKVAAGSYSLFTIPSAGEWTVALNKEKDLWGAYKYKPENDVVHVKVKPAAAEYEEWMQLTFEDLTNTSANLVLHWEKLKVAVPIAVDVNTKVLADCRAAVASAKADDWRTPWRAAGFCLENQVALDEGRKWLDKSVGIKQHYFNLSLLARYQMKDGKKQDAVATAQKALAAAKAGTDTLDTVPTERMLKEWMAAK